MSKAVYDDRIGWARVPGVLTPERAGRIVEACETTLAAADFVSEVGDKPASGTHRLVRVPDRIDVASDVGRLPPIVDLVEAVLGPTHHLTEAGYRSPQPGFGGQKLHADDLPRTDVDSPYGVVTAIVALVDFTAVNGATRVLPGSHHRPDLQLAAGSLGDPDDQVVVEMAAGDALVFNGHLLHSGTRNDGDHARPALQLVYRTAPGPDPAPGGRAAGSERP